jgi:uncharacterized protein with HEPN domain
MLRIPDYLQHISEAIEKIFGYVNGLDETGFLASRLIQDATIRNLEIIGEAARNILRADPSFAARHPTLPLGQAIGMRDTLSHGYFEVKLDAVWTTIKRDLPDLNATVKDILLAETTNKLTRPKV